MQDSYKGEREQCGVGIGAIGIAQAASRKCPRVESGTPCACRLSHADFTLALCTDLQTTTTTVDGGRGVCVWWAMCSRMGAHWPQFKTL